MVSVSRRTSGSGFPAVMLSIHTSAPASVFPLTWVSVTLALSPHVF